MKVEYSLKKVQVLVVNEWFWMAMNVFKDVVQGEFACLITIFHRKNEDSYYKRDVFNFIAFYDHHLYFEILVWNIRTIECETKWL